MIDDKYLLILEKLKEGTEKGKVIWMKTSSNTEYQTRLGASTITIDNWSVDNLREDFCEVVFLNSEGNAVKQLIFGGNTEIAEYNYIFNIYSIVKNKYLKEDETLDDIMRHLS